MRRILILLLVATGCSALKVTPEMSPREAYVARYAAMARAEMKRSGVPASITLAQGMLESGNGTSRLAVKGRNHFGIKCHKDWKADGFLRTTTASKSAFGATEAYANRTGTTVIFCGRAPGIPLYLNSNPTTTGAGHRAFRRRGTPPIRSTPSGLLR